MSSSKSVSVIQVNLYGKYFLVSVSLQNTYVDIISSLRPITPLESVTPVHADMNDKTIFTYLEFHPRSL